MCGITNFLESVTVYRTMAGNYRRKNIGIRRDLVIRSLKNFSEAELNAYHYALADFVSAGAMVITTNFDIYIEKALGIKADETGVKNVDGSVR